MKLGSHQSPEAREKVRQANLGKKVSPETRERMRQANPGRKPSAQTIEKLRQNALKLWTDPTYREKQRLLKLRMGQSPEYRQKQRENRLRQMFPQKMSSIERLLYSEFKKRRLHFKMHKTMFGRWQPDFVFEQARLIVQADGDYWHKWPDRKARDYAFGKTASAHGWSVWRFGEREILMHAPACARAVARFVRDH